MLLNTFKCGAVLLCGAVALAGLHLSHHDCPGARTLALAGLTVCADDKKDDTAKPALSGVWVQSGGELKLEFADKGVMKIHPHGDKAEIAIVCKCTVDKDGLVKAKVSEHEGKDEVKNKINEVVPVGQEFSFRWQVKDDKATLDDLKGDKVDHLKAHLEGKYDKK
jgi:hypothetical protein